MVSSPISIGGYFKKVLLLNDIKKTPLVEGGISGLQNGAVGGGPFLN